MISGITGTGVIVLSALMTLGALVLVWINTWIDGRQEYRYRKQYREDWIDAYHEYRRTDAHATPNGYVSAMEKAEKKGKGKKHPINPPTPNIFPYWRKSNPRHPNRRWVMADEGGPKFFPLSWLFITLALVVFGLEVWFFISVFKVKVDGNAWTETHEVLDKYIGWAVIIMLVMYVVGLAVILSEKLTPKYARSSHMFRDIPPLDEDERV
jgi:hypothetical protein